MARHSQSGKNLHDIKPKTILDILFSSHRQTALCFVQYLKANIL